MRKTRIDPARIWVAPILLLAGFLIGSSSLHAQCVVTLTTTDMPGLTTTLVSKYLAAAYNCASIPTQNNAYDCNPGAAMTTDLLTAEAMAATMDPKCVWNCACGMVTIDGSDGLPVELMGFSVDPEESAESEEDAANAERGR